MSEALQYYQALIDNEVTLVSSGLVFVFVFQLVIFRWAERSGAITATYFITTTSVVGGPFLAAIIATPNRSFSIYDLVVTWTLLSFLVTMIGIVCSGSPQHTQHRPESDGMVDPAG